MTTSGFERFSGGWSWPGEASSTPAEPRIQVEEGGPQSRRHQDLSEDLPEIRQTMSSSQSQRQQAEFVDTQRARTEERPRSPSRQQPRQRFHPPRTCRICFETVNPTIQLQFENIPGVFQPSPKVVYESEDGPLIRPCKCKGSSRYVHESCLQQWRNADPNNKRNYWECPTCGFKYRLSRLGIGRLVAGRAAQLTLTIFILFLAVFILGFIADPILDLYYGGYSTLADTFSGDGYKYEPFNRDEPETWISQDDRETWLDHFLKGFASLGLISFLKVLLADPLAWFRTSGIASGGARAGTTGRARMANVSWLVVLIGVATFLYTVYKLVRLWSARFLRSAGQKVMDVQGDDDDNDDDDNDREGEDAEPR